MYLSILFGFKIPYMHSQRMACTKR